MTYQNKSERVSVSEAMRLAINYIKTKQDQNIMKITKIIEELKAIKNRSAWDKGVNNYALGLIDGLESEELTLESMSALLNGASDWSGYSYGGCAHIYDEDVANALCSPSEIKRTDGGRLHPSKRESWLDCQARALSQAARLVSKAFKA